MPAPAQDQLKPIDATVTPPTAAQTQKTADAVKEILGKDAIVSDQVKQAQTAKMTEPTEVTPHAREVIVVKKAYNASSSQAVNAAGVRILSAGQYNEAADMFDSQLKKNPSDPLALAGKAQALQRAGRIDEALRTYDRLLQLNPRDLEALTNSLGLVQQQNPQKALTKLQSLVQQYPDNAAVAGQLATTQARMMDTPNALRNFQKAMALDPTNPTYPFNMAVLYDRLGSSDKARATYRQALDVANAYPQKASNVPLQVIRDRMASMSN
jgi:Flp pilus assembly protein TadD